MNMFTRTTMALAVPALSLTALTAPSYGVDTDTKEAQAKTANFEVDAKKKGTKSNNKCDKAPGSFQAPNGITVLNIKTCFNVKILKKMGCDTEAGKIERPAPPRDPKSKCKGKAKVTFKLKYETPDCPTGYIGGKLRLKLDITQKLKALGLSKSIATGEVDTWARTKIKIHDKFKGEVTNDCVLVPIVPPPPTTPGYECISFNVVKGDGRTVRVNAFSTNQSGGASFKDATITWGDGSQSSPTANPIGATHTFDNDGTFLVKVSTAFNVNGQEKVTNDAACQALVTFTAQPPEEENNPPAGTISGLPHQYSNDTDSNVGYVYFMTRDSDGDTVTYNNFRVINSGGATAHAGNVLPSAVLADGTACPTGAKCYRGEVWAGTTPGSASVAVDITDGKSDPVTLSAGPWTIFADDRGE